ncbi:MAG: hypothetical protein GYB64_16055, partial [Chloroflexi bacterium]|nr:hypothetical protein [Chloroflexota bacterium]
PAARLETLREPARLFHLRLDVPLIAGIMPATMISVVAQFAALISLALSGITLIPVLVLVDSLVTQSPETVLRLLNITLGAQLVMLLVVGGLPVIALGTLVAGTLGLQVERDAIAGLALGQGRGIIPYIRLLVPSAVFTLGVLIGLALTPIGLFMPLSLLIGSDVGLGSLVRILLETAVWFTAITALMWGWLCVTRFSAHRVLGTHVGEKPPRLKRQVLNLWLGLVMGGALLAAAVAQVLIYRDVAGLVNSLGPPLSAVGLVAAMYVITVIGVWALTRVGLLLRRRCPTCGERVRTPIAVGATCDSCDSKLAPWAYID